MMEMNGISGLVDNAMENMASARTSKLKSMTNQINSRENMEKTAKDFEAFFVSQMMENMFQGIPTDGMFGGGEAEGVYRSMLVNEYGKMIANKGGIGIADKVMSFMIQAQSEATVAQENEGKVQ